jgi:uncharacterized damage-inducible protein DinB
MDTVLQGKIILLQQYADLPLRLKKTLHGLSVSDYSLARQEGKWTIREIVQHLVDADSLVHTLVLVALGNPGCVYDQTWYKIDNSWAQILKYQQRSIDLALALYKANHQSLVELLKILPDSLERHLVLRWAKDPAGSKITVEQLIQSRIQHTQHHLAQIIETRRQHKV